VQDIKISSIGKDKSVQAACLCTEQTVRRAWDPDSRFNIPPSTPASRALAASGKRLIVGRWGHPATRIDHDHAVAWSFTALTAHDLLVQGHGVAHGRQHGGERSGVAWRQVAHDDSQDCLHFIDESWGWPWLAGAPDDALGEQELVKAVPAAVDVDHSGPDLLGDPVAADRVGGPDAAEAELAITPIPRAR
jgi:hypothetical protein